MNWEAIGAVAELLGALGVIASLFYLGLQIRYTRLNEVKDAIDSNYQIFNDVRKALFENEDLSRIFMDGVAAPEKLNDYETFRFMAVSETMFMNGETFWKQLEGRADERLEIILNFLAAYLETPGGKAFWAHPQSQNITPSFRKYIENRGSDEAGRLHRVSA